MVQLQQLLMCFVNYVLTDDNMDEQIQKKTKVEKDVITNARIAEKMLCLHFKRDILVAKVKIDEIGNTYKYTATYDCSVNLNKKDKTKETNEEVADMELKNTSEFIWDYIKSIINPKHTMDKKIMTTFLNLTEKWKKHRSEGVKGLFCAKLLNKNRLHVDLTKFYEDVDKQKGLEFMKTHKFNFVLHFVDLDKSFYIKTSSKPFKIIFNESEEPEKIEFTEPHVEESAGSWKKLEGWMYRHRFLIVFGLILPSILLIILIILIYKHKRVRR